MDGPLLSGVLCRPEFCKFVVLRERKKQLYSIDEAANLNFLSTQEQLKVYEKIELFHEQFGLINFLVFVPLLSGVLCRPEFQDGKHSRTVLSNGYGEIKEKKDPPTSKYAYESSKEHSIDVLIQMVGRFREKYFYDSFSKRSCV
jgi:hypothetical protein